MRYERLIIETEKEVKIKEKPLKYGLKGLYKNRKIIIDSRLKTTAEKTCILSEELGHHFTTVGNIIDQSKIENRQQERKARAWGYEKLVGIINLVNAYKDGVRSRFELAEYLEVTEDYIEDAIKYYKEKHGLYCEIDNYIVYFEPLVVLEKL
ncbi:hypothetical protein KQI88_15075 [Alkaliphilus sp. MSJ-5]|uniref:IrrE N-terminal-like domain-containing protein n=1 Tax=Alkaliphilus flagellatus TaxID=2841507 RepID=A0ABS6G6G6_9FIRM|nr:ImmA/IrrE family metallo-endopeptidase [Alkaliphilus flagellatus]MBU5677741.1 hypothetical protein [Alkaliphilus flagellatus]